MVNDSQYQKRAFRLSEIEHRYGDQVHVLDDPYLFSKLARLCHPSCQQPVVNQLLHWLYQAMLRTMINHEFPLIEQELETRMAAMHAEGKFRAPVVDPNTQVVCVNLARAGTVPSQICYDSLNYLLEPSGVRQDHISINRKVDEAEHVVGTNLGGMKIGGDITNRFVIFPDPMGATGSTIKTALEIYRQHGKPKRFIAIHLIVTPEYLAAVKDEKDFSVYALRLDRGLSPAKVLSTVPGSHWRDERGLNSKQYIVPGGGGLGEVINNSYV